MAYVLYIKECGTCYVKILESENYTAYKIPLYKFKNAFQATPSECNQASLLVQSPYELRHGLVPNKYVSNRSQNMYI